MKTIQLSLQVADEITSTNQLEQHVNHLGQQIKRQLLTNMLAQLRQYHRASMCVRTELITPDRAKHNLDRLVLHQPFDLLAIS